MEHAYSTFGQWVRMRRKERGLTQKALGLQVGYAEITVRQIEKDTYSLTRFIVERFVNRLTLERSEANAVISLALKQSPGTSNSAAISPNYQPGTPFIGRHAELKQIGDLLRNPDCRCIAIVGVGGAGKTRLAMQAIAALTGEAFREVRVIDLTEATTAEQMARAIAHTVGIALAPFGSPVEQLLQALASKDLLLVLDNFEQLLPDGAVFLAALIEQASGIQMIVTSRERLQIRGEWAIRLQGLGMTLESPLADAVALFISTAQRQNHRFVPSEAEAIHAICRLLQGIPLAIEMAASWTDVYNCAEILTNVTDKALDLTSRYRDVDERHRSLLAVFESTWERLSAYEQKTLMRLAVFRGGFDLSAVQNVALADKSILAFLQEKMLVQLQHEGRLTLHEMIRQLALQKLMLDEQAWHDTRLAHAGYFVEMFSNSANKIKYGDAHEAILHINRELENMYVAWNTLLAQRRTDWFELCWESIWLYFNVTSRFREGEELFRAAANTFASNISNAQRLTAFSGTMIATFIMRQGRIPEARELILSPQIEAICDIGSPFEKYYFYFMKSYIFHAIGDSQVAMASMVKGLQIFDLLEVDPYYYMTSLFQVGRVWHMIGDYEAAYQSLSDSLHMYAEHKTGWGRGLILTELGLLAETMGRINDALHYYEAVLAAATAWEEVWNYHRTRISIGRVKLALGQIQEAVAIFYATLQDLQHNPQLGLEIDCLVEVGLVLWHFDDVSGAFLLLEYCSTHSECFQPVRDRAADYLKKLMIERPDLNVSAARNLFPAKKRDVAAMLLDRLAQIKQLSL